MKLAAKPLAFCRQAMIAEGYTPPTDTAVAQMVESDVELVEALNQFYTGDQDRLDAFSREWLLETFSIYFVGSLWPDHNDGLMAIQSFNDALAQAVTAAGWRLNR